MTQQKTEDMLSPYRVLDLTDEKGLMCGKLLGNLGADVIKIEKPGGDPSRNIGPFFHDIPDPQKSLFWFAFNVNKRGITLNLENRDGREIFKKLAKSADVVIESFEPGHMDRLGLSYSELEKVNRGIIMTSITPFGQSGPYVERKYKASDLVLWALGGMLFSSGSRGRGPVRISHLCQAFLLGSSDAAWATAMALYWRGMSGEGQHIDVSIQESVERHALCEYVDWKATGIAFIPVGDKFVVRFMRPGEAGIVAAIAAIERQDWVLKDGSHIVMGVSGGRHAHRLIPPLLEWMASEGMADEFLTKIDWENTIFEELPQEDRERIYGCFERFFKTKTRAQMNEEIVKRGLYIELIWSPREVLEHPQLKARGYYQKIEHDDLGVTLTYPGHLYKSSQTASKLEYRTPLIGEHNQQIYVNELGFTSDELVILKQGGVI